MATFTEVTKERYEEMLEVLPPAMWLGGDFLVGEPMDHRPCSVVGEMRATYSAFFYRHGKYYVADESLTPNEFKRARQEMEDRTYAS